MKIKAMYLVTKEIEVPDEWFRKDLENSTYYGLSAYEEVENHTNEYLKKYSESGNVEVEMFEIKDLDGNTIGEW